MSSHPFEWRMNRRSFTVGAGLSVAALSGLTSLPTLAAASTQALPALAVVAKDYSFELPASATSGFTTVTLENQGMAIHHAIFLKLNDGVTVDQVAAAKSEVEVFTLGESLGGPMAGPGGKESVIMDLKEGKYAIVCVIPGPDGMPHYQMGMISPFDVTPGTSTAVAPTASMTIELEEMMFQGLPSSVPTGAATWEIRNAGTVVHEMVIFKLDPGVTPDQVLAMVLGPSTPATPSATPQATPVAGPPPFSAAGAVAPMSVGYTAYPMLTFDAGNYLAACFVFDPSTGKPHALMGMLMPFTAA